MHPESKFPALSTVVRAQVISLVFDRHLLGRMGSGERECLNLDIAGFIPASLLWVWYCTPPPFWVTCMSLFMEYDVFQGPRSRGARRALAPPPPPQ